MHPIITLKITNVYSFRNYIIQFELRKLYTLKQSHKYDEKRYYIYIKLALNTNQSINTIYTFRKNEQHICALYGSFLYGAHFQN